MDAESLDGQLSFARQFSYPSLIDYFSRHPALRYHRKMEGGHEFTFEGDPRWFCFEVNQDPSVAIIAKGSGPYNGFTIAPLMEVGAPIKYHVSVTSTGRLAMPLAREFVTKYNAVLCA